MHTYLPTYLAAFCSTLVPRRQFQCPTLMVGQIESWCQAHCMQMLRAGHCAEAS